MKKYSWPAIAFILAFAVRSYGLFQPGLLGSDPYYHFAFFREFLTDFNNNFSLSSYPGGIANSQPLGLYIILLPLSIFGPFLAVKLMPAIIGGITAVSAYYFGKKYFDEKYGIAAGLLTGVTVAHIARTVSGNYRGEIFIPPLIMIGLYFFDHKDLKKILTSATIFGLAGFFWFGYPYAYIVFIATYFAILGFEFVESKIEAKDIFLFLSSIFFLRAFSYLLLRVGILRLEHPFFSVYYLLYILPVFVALMKYSQNKVSEKIKKQALYSSIAGVIALVFLLQMFFSVDYDLLQPSDEFFKNITELAPQNFYAVFNNYFLMFPLAFAGAYVFLKNLNREKMLIFPYIILSIYLLISAKRFSFLASIPMILLSSFSFNFVKKKYRLRIVLIIVAVQLLWSVYLMADLEYIEEDWVSALDWINQNTPEGSSFAVIWDDASKIQAMTNRPTIVDSVSGQNIERIERIAKFIVGEEYDDFQDLKVDYLVLSYENFLQFTNMHDLLGTETLGYQVLKFEGIEELDGVQTFKFYGEDEVIFYNTVPPFALNKYQGFNILLNRTIVYQNGNYSEYSAPSLPYTLSEGCFFLSEDGGFLFSEDVCNSNFVKLFFFERLSGYTLEYKNPFVKIYSIENSE